ncbi:MAG: MscL family protein [Candidatus Paceibacterota bacterium]|nr:MAG: MscL family protein [Candidatus Paceibacterota bacterium]
MFTGFLQFIRQKDVLGFGVGFVIGGAVSGLVTSFVNDILNPVVGLLLSQVQDLKSATLSIGSASILWGSFILQCINFLILALVVYAAVRMIGGQKSS